MATEEKARDRTRDRAPDIDEREDEADAHRLTTPPSFGASRWAMARTACGTAVPEAPMDLLTALANDTCPAGSMSLRLGRREVHALPGSSPEVACASGIGAAGEGVSGTARR